MHSSQSMAAMRQNKRKLKIERKTQKEYVCICIWVYMWGCGGVSVGVWVSESERESGCNVLGEAGTAREKNIIDDHHLLERIDWAFRWLSETVIPPPPSSFFFSFFFFFSPSSLFCCLDSRFRWSGFSCHCCKTRSPRLRDSHKVSRGNASHLHHPHHSC